VAKGWCEAFCAAIVFEQAQRDRSIEDLVERNPVLAPGLADRSNETSDLEIISGRAAATYS
jgi:hypothetical protein